MPYHHHTVRARLAQTIDHQYASERFPEVRATFDRLRALQFTDTEIHELCVQVLATEYYRHVIPGDAFDDEGYAGMLQRLPLLPWDDPEAPDADSLTEEAVCEAVLDNPDLIIETTMETRHRYRHIRTALTQLHTKLLHLAGPEAIRASAVALGLLTASQSVADIADDHTLAVVADHCLYADSNQRTAWIETYRDEVNVAEESDEAELLAAMDDTQFCVLRCGQRIPELGVVVHDVVRGREFVLIDSRLAEGAIPNLLIVAQVINPHGLYITTGAALVVPGPEAWQAVRQLLEEAPGGAAGDAFDDADLAGPLITRLKRLLIAHGALMSSDEK